MARGRRRRSTSLRRHRGGEGERERWFGDGERAVVRGASQLRPETGRDKADISTRQLHV
jgi:hypothetical protein